MYLHLQFQASASPEEGSVPWARGGPQGVGLDRGAPPGRGQGMSATLGPEPEGEREGREGEGKGR